MRKQGKGREGTRWNGKKERKCDTVWEERKGRIGEERWKKR